MAVNLDSLVEIRELLAGIICRMVYWSRVERCMFCFMLLFYFIIVYFYCCLNAILIDTRAEVR